MKIPNILKGNDFIVTLKLTYFTNSETNQKVSEFDLNKCSDIFVYSECNVPYKQIPLKFRIYGNDTLIINCYGEDFDYESTYSLVVTANSENGYKLKYRLDNDEFVRIINRTSYITTESDWVEISSIDLNGRIGFNAPNVEGIQGPQGIQGIQRF